MATAAVDHPSQRIPNAAFYRILDRVACGESIIGASNRLRKAGEVVPSAARFIRWCQKTPERWQRYLRAKVASSEVHVDRMHHIADTAGDACDDPARFNAEVQKARLRIETRKWTASKLNPLRFGDKLQHEHSGSLSVTVATGVDLLGASPTPRIGVSLDSLLDGEEVRDAAVRVLPAAPASTAAPAASPARLGGDAFDALD